jgi:uncharacterized protein YggE
MESQPDTIQVSVSQRGELDADRADLSVAIQGSSYVAGRAALTQAREIAELAEGLRTLGVDDGDIQVVDVQAHTSGGLIGRSSSAVYHLRIRCRDLSRLGDMIGMVTSRTSQLTSLTWGYPDDHTIRGDLLDAAIERAQAEARVIAEGFGVRLLAVHTLTSYLEHPGAAPAEMSLARARGVSSADFGLEMAHTKEVTLRLDVSYRVSPFPTPE